MAAAPSSIPRSTRLLEMSTPDTGIPRDHLELLMTCMHKHLPGVDEHNRASGGRFESGLAKLLSKAYDLAETLPHPDTAEVHRLCVKVDNLTKQVINLRTKVRSLEDELTLERSIRAATRVRGPAADALPALPLEAEPFRSYSPNSTGIAKNDLIYLGTTLRSNIPNTREINRLCDGQFEHEIAKMFTLAYDLAAHSLPRDSNARELRGLAKLTGELNTQIKLHRATERALRDDLENMRNISSDQAKRIAELERQVLELSLRSPVHESEAPSPSPATSLFASTFLATPPASSPSPEARGVIQLDSSGSSASPAPFSSAEPARPAGSPETSLTSMDLMESDSRVSDSPVPFSSTPPAAHVKPASSRARAALRTTSSPHADRDLDRNARFSHFRTKAADRSSNWRG